VSQRGNDCNLDHEAHQEGRHDARNAVEEKVTEPIAEAATRNQIAADAEEPGDRPAAQ
jgi:hypothetical protein